ncbi:hypothetical protein ACFL4G_12375 [Thermodesulfobacteriota bacterium]
MRSEKTILSLTLCIVSSLLLAAGCAGIKEHYLLKRVPVEPIDPGLSIMVFPIADRSPEISTAPWISEIRIYNTFVGELKEAYAFDLVDRGALLTALEEMNLRFIGSMDTQTKLRIAKALEAEILISCDYSIMGDMFELDARVFNVENGEVLTRESVFGGSAQAVPMAQRLANKVLKNFDLQ